MAFASAMNDDLPGGVQRPAALPPSVAFCCAALHARAIREPPPWSERAFAEVLSDPLSFVLGAGSSTRAVRVLSISAAAEPLLGLAAGRVVSGEAELLTLVTDPLWRKHGLGRQLLRAFELEAAQRGAERAFLEVAETNAAARALYERAGWQFVGQRRDYYHQGGAALLMAKALARTSN